MSIVLHLTGTRRDRGGPVRQKTRGEPMNGIRARGEPMAGSGPRGEPSGGTHARGEPQAGPRTRGEPDRGIHTRGEPIACKKPWITKRSEGWRKTRGEPEPAKHWFPTGFRDKIPVVAKAKSSDPLLE